MNWLKSLLWRRQIPIDSVMLLSVKPGDVLVFSIPAPMSPPSYERVTRKLNEFCKESFAFPVKVMVITGGLELQAIRPAGVA